MAVKDCTTVAQEPTPARESYASGKDGTSSTEHRVSNPHVAGSSPAGGFFSSIKFKRVNLQRFARRVSKRVGKIQRAAKMIEQAGAPTRETMRIRFDI